LRKAILLDEARRGQNAAKMIKQRAGRRLVSVNRRVIFGVEELIPVLTENSILAMKSSFSDDAAPISSTD
jgi:hypothetical protein